MKYTSRRNDLTNTDVVDLNSSKWRSLHSDQQTGHLLHLNITKITTDNKRYYNNCYSKKNILRKIEGQQCVERAEWSAKIVVTC